MRGLGNVLAGIALAALCGVVAASGCTDLASSCELQITCTPVAPPPMCTGIFDPSGTCASCAEAACCQEASDCQSNGNCLNYCVSGYWPPADVCATDAVKQLSGKLAACLKTSCSPQCDAHDTCNPVLGTGCGTAASCEPFVPGTFGCLPPLGTVLAKLCETCDVFVDPVCGAGLHCFKGASTTQCARYCCDDADCGTGKCLLDQTMAFGAPLLDDPKVGICLTMDGASPACDAPAVSPSNGSCIASAATP